MSVGVQKQNKAMSYLVLMTGDKCQSWKSFKPQEGTISLVELDIL